MLFDSPCISQTSSTDLLYDSHSSAAAAAAAAAEFCVQDLSLSDLALPTYTLYAQAPEYLAAEARIDIGNYSGAQLPCAR